MSEIKSNNGKVADYLLDIEAEIERIKKLPIVDESYHSLRRQVSIAIHKILNDQSKPSSLLDCVSLANKSGDRKAQRLAALMLVRIAPLGGAIPNDATVERGITQLFEVALPDMAKVLDMSQMRQPYAKLQAIREIHAKVCDKLEVIADVPESPDKLSSARTDIERAMADPLVNSYLQPYGFVEIRQVIRMLLSKLGELLSTKDQSYSTRLISLREDLSAEVARAIFTKTFFCEMFFSPFLKNFTNAIALLEQESRERFVCEINPSKAGSDIAEKHYPLHEANRSIRVTIGLNNIGPGVALDVRAELSGNSNNVAYDDQFSLGDRQPGQFPLTFEVLVVQSTKSENMALSISWLEVGNQDRREKVLDLRLVGQRPDVNWVELESKQPYGTEVAEGEEFVGRALKLKTLAARYLKDRMNSSFITGQKRVGKTSLARAFESHILNSPKGKAHKILWLEYGSYSHSEPIQTAEALGKEIAEFLIAHQKQKTDLGSLSFQGSLAPLNKLADSLLKEDPSQHYIIILDEFDEIHEEMYRYGPLAETFFSNLRALSAKKNIAFLLVGGERMPFIMSAQGDQLNRFVKEPLDYFSRVAEWDDYIELVCKPVHGSLSWSNSAVNRLFDLTNGHPYYTKLMCNRVYTTAVAERDAEITDAEVDRAAAELVRELDANSFAHVWKDGIQQVGQEAEVMELRRRRILCSIARGLRSQGLVSAEIISANRSGLKLSDAEIAPLLNDFERRGFIVNKGAHYEFAIPMFGDWLIAHGGAQLMSDALAEEYEAALAKAEDAAFVTPAEIGELIRRWHVYQGQAINGEQVRAWLHQAPSNQDRRLLLKILQNLRFFSSMEIREKLKTAHDMLTQFLRPFRQEKKVDRRNDVVVTYVDGLGKSGARYASLYAEENRIATSCVMPPSNILEAIARHEQNMNESVTAIIIVDDLVASGHSLAKNVRAFLELNHQLLTDRGIRVFVVTISSTKEGEAYVRKALSKVQGIELDFRFCEVVQDQHYAFGAGKGIWADMDEYARAKALCNDLGARVQKNNPLGYEGQGLLVVFPDNCPNNSLPILHSGEERSGGWNPLFRRSKK